MALPFSIPSQLHSCQAAYGVGQAVGNDSHALACKCC